MQLKLTRAQRSGGMVRSKVVFQLNARVELSPEERSLVAKYGLGSMVVYDSEARKKHGQAASSQLSDVSAGGHGIAGSLWKTAKGLGSAAMMALSLRITVDSLQQGQMIECQSLDELLGAEEAINEACRNLKVYLDVAETFDGREVVVAF